MTDPTRTPYCHKIRYGISGVPILTEDEMDGSHAPGIGVQPKLIELIYSAARDGKPASVSASVTGAWTRFGEPADGEVAVHFKNGPDGWPTWLAEEARLHDPASAGVAPDTDRAGLRDRIRRVLAQCDGFDFDSLEPHDYQIQAAAIEAVLPASAGQADRAAVLEEAAARLEAMTSDAYERALSENEIGYANGLENATKELRRMAAVPAGSADAGHSGSETGTPCGPAPDQCDPEAGEPCADHEREQAHAEGEHCFCGPECTRACTCGAAGDCFVPAGHYANCPQAAGQSAGGTHSCGNCDGIDPDTCLTNPDRTPAAEVVHGCPPDGSGLTPCCGRTPFELPLGDRISSEAPVTCPGANGAAPQEGTR